MNIFEKLTLIDIDRYNAADNVLWVIYIYINNKWKR